MKGNFMEIQDSDRPRRIAIIPARGGSKRIPDKNIRDFCGRPMIAYILETAQRSGLFDIIHVSSESRRIIDTVERLGFAVDFPRPMKLADDHTPIMPVLKYVVETYLARGETFDQIFLLDATAPLIDAEDLKGAAALFETIGEDKVVLAITEYPVPVEWAYERKDDGTLTPVQPSMFSARSQDLDLKYYDSGCFAVFSSSRISSAALEGDDSYYIGYVIPKYKVVDIDYPQDWILAETLFRGFRTKRLE